MYVIKGDGTLAFMGGIDDKPTTRLDDLKTAKNFVDAGLNEVAAGRPVSVTTSRPYGWHHQVLFVSSPTVRVFASPCDRRQWPSLRTRGGRKERHGLRLADRIRSRRPPTGEAKSDGVPRWGCLGAAGGRATPTRRVQRLGPAVEFCGARRRWPVQTADAPSLPPRSCRRRRLRHRGRRRLGASSSQDDLALTPPWRGRLCTRRRPTPTRAPAPRHRFLDHRPAPDPQVRAAHLGDRRRRARPSLCRALLPSALRRRAGRGSDESQDGGIDNLEAHRGVGAGGWMDHKVLHARVRWVEMDQHLRICICTRAIARRS